MTAVHPDWTVDRVMRPNRLADDDAARWDRLRRGIQAPGRRLPEPETVPLPVGRRPSATTRPGGYRGGPVGTCPVCGLDWKLDVGGTVYWHGPYENRCPGSGQPAVTA